MAATVKLGMLTPSSNTVLEPATTAMVSGVPEVSVHFARFRVTEISLGEASQAQFDSEVLLEAARLLADARVDVIGWNGTSASWLGFERDEHLCRSIEKETGIPATSSVLAMNEILVAAGIRRFGLVTPYRKEVQDRIVANYETLGLSCVAERHFGARVNYAFAEVTEAQITAMIREVARARPETILTVCTNMASAPLVADIEEELGIPVCDSITAVVWKSLHMAGVDARRVHGWGRLFASDGLKAGSGAA
ncbi:MAG: aspartate/glutamate racemase family protein [Alphaproteobacteria bacterium]